jgi:hypothetical protein
MPLRTIKGLLTKSEYQVQLSSPEWEKFAKYIRHKRGNFCQICRRTNVSTQVHHSFYDPTLKLWQHSEDDVILLCAACHKKMHAELQKFRRYVFSKFTPQSFRAVNGALAAALEKYDPLVFAHALAEFVSTPSLVQRYADAWDVDAQEKLVKQLQKPS